MDTYTQPVPPKRRYLELEQKRRIVEETLAEGASVAQIARVHGVNANLVFNWRRLCGRSNSQPDFLRSMTRQGMMVNDARLPERYSGHATARVSLAGARRFDGDR